MHYAFELGYNAYNNGQAINPFEDEKGVMSPEVCRYTLWEKGFAQAAEEDLEFERGIRRAFELIDTENREEPVEGDYFNDDMEYPQ